MNANASLSNCTCPWFSEDEDMVLAKMVGTARPIIAKKSIDAWMPTFSLLKVCSLNLKPPAMTLNPKMRSILPMIEPVMDALTRSRSPALMAITAIMISAALPKVTFRSDPAVGP
jgi:hypothetical protein